MASKVLDRLILKGTIDGYDDERASGNALLIYLPSGKQWRSDPTCHTQGFDTVTAALAAIKVDITDYPEDPELINA